MKLLFDQNLSYKLVAAVADLFPDSAHVRVLGMQQASDEAIWTWAKDHGFVIVSKDDDFHQRSFLYGWPPKVVWLRLGNCSTARIIDCLRRHVNELKDFEADAQASFLSLS